MENIKQILFTALNPKAKFVKDAQNLVEKWKSHRNYGYFMDRLPTDFDKCLLAVLTENQWGTVDEALVRRATLFIEQSEQYDKKNHSIEFPGGLIYYLKRI